MLLNQIKSYNKIKKFQITNYKKKHQKKRKTF